MTSFISLLTTLGLLNLPQASAQAASVARGDAPGIPRQSLSSGFAVTPTALTVSLVANSSINIPLTVTRETSGTLGSCTGHYEITETELISRALFEAPLAITATQSVASVQLTLSTWNNEYGYVIGDGPVFHNGETGVTDFTAANEPDFDQVVAKFTDGVNEGIMAGWDYFDGGGGPAGGGFAYGDESWAFQTDSDLIGHKINLIRRDVKQLVLQSAQAHFEVIWSIWGRPFFSRWLQFSPKSGDLAVGESQLVSVTFSAANMAPGIYTTSLTLDPGQTCGTPIGIPVSMSIPEPCRPVRGVDLGPVTTGTIFPSSTVGFSANVSPTLATRPFSFTINHGAVLTSSDNPISFTWNFTNSGFNTTTISVWNCEMATTEAMTDSVLSFVAEPVITRTLFLFLPTVIK